MRRGEELSRRSQARAAAAARRARQLTSRVTKKLGCMKIYLCTVHTLYWPNEPDSFTERPPCICGSSWLREMPPSRASSCLSGGGAGLAAAAALLHAGAACLRPRRSRTLVPSKIAACQDARKLAAIRRATTSRRVCAAARAPAAGAFPLAVMMRSLRSPRPVFAPFFGGCAYVRPNKSYFQRKSWPALSAV